MKKHGLGQPHWNAHQVYAWVYTRNPRLVVLLSDRDEGDSVEPSVIDFIAMTVRPGAEFADHAEAQEAIVSTLQEGRLRSWGRREGAGVLEEIPAVEWVDLHFVWSVFHGSVEAVGMTDDPPSSIVGAPRWYGLRFKRDDVLELWPPTETEIETGAEDPPAQTLPPHDAQPSTPAKADQAQTHDELKDWFVTVYVPAHKNDSPNPTRAAALSAAKPEFANYCDRTHLRDDLRKIWRHHAPKGWKKTGPRAKTKKIIPAK